MHTLAVSGKPPPRRHSRRRRESRGTSDSIIYVSSSLSVFGSSSNSGLRCLISAVIPEKAGIQSGDLSRLKERGQGAYINLRAVILVTPVITADGCNDWGDGNPEERAVASFMYPVLQVARACVAQSLLLFHLVILRCIKFVYPTSPQL